MKFANALSIFTAPFPLPFMGEDAGGSVDLQTISCDDLGSTVGCCS